MTQIINQKSFNHGTIKGYKPTFFVVLLVTIGAFLLFVKILIEKKILIHYILCSTQNQKVHGGIDPPIPTVKTPMQEFKNLFS